MHCLVARKLPALLHCSCEDSAFVGGETAGEQVDRALGWFSDRINRELSSRPPSCHLFVQSPSSSASQRGFACARKGVVNTSLRRIFRSPKVLRSLIHLFVFGARRPAEQRG